jgi:hypothetical protein
VTVGESRDAPKSDLVPGRPSFMGTASLPPVPQPSDEKYTQDDYYHFAAFFLAVATDRQRPTRRRPA